MWIKRDGHTQSSRNDGGATLIASSSRPHVNLFDPSASCRSTFDISGLRFGLRHPRRALRRLLLAGRRRVDLGPPLLQWPTNN